VQNNIDIPARWYFSKGGHLAEPLLSARRLAIIGASVIVAFFISALSFLHLTTPDWSTETALNADTETKHDMAIDSQGKANIASVDTCLRFIRKTDGGWSTATLKDWYWHDRYSGVSIVLDSQDSAYICAGYDSNDYSDHGLTIATNRDGNWVVEDVPLDYRHLSSFVAVDNERRIHVLCSCVESESDYYEGHMLHFYEGPDGWECSEMFAPTTNSTSRIHSFEIGALDSMHALVETEVYVDVEYFLVASRTLNYASTLSGDWTQEVVTSFDAESLYKTRAAEKSMAIDGNGKVHVCRYVWDNSTASYSIAYMTNEDGEWSLDNLSYAGNFHPSSCSIDIDSTGSIHIAYYARYYESRYPEESISNQTERYLTNSDGSWKQKILDDKRGWSTQEICVAVGPDDGVRISYFADIPRETGGDDYKVLYTTPAVEAETIADAVTGASLYTFAFSLTVGVVVLVYFRRRGRKLTQAEDSEDT
jgi:hypothetical protein